MRLALAVTSFGLLVAHAADSNATNRTDPPASTPPVIRISTEIVQLDAVVTDRRGRHVLDLQPADFEVLQDGRPQQVSRLVYVRAGLPARPEITPAGTAPPSAAAAPAGAAGPPRTILIVVDDLSLSLHSFDRTRRSLKRTIELLDPADRVEVITTGRGYDALRPTTDRKANWASVDGLRLTPWTRGELMSASSSQSTFFALQQGLGSYETADWTMRSALRSIAVVKETIKDLHRLPGRKAMLLVSEGFSGLASLGGSQIHDLYWPLDRLYGDSDDVLGAWKRLADFAARASVVIHAVDPRGLVTGGLNAEHRVPDAAVAGRLAEAGLARRIALHHSQGTLEQLTEATGGLAMLDRNDMGSAVLAILEDLAGYYLIGYEPAPGTFEGGGFHDVAIRMKRPGLKVRSRKGFFAVTDEQVAASLP